ncbi:BadF/BadG/BcrA/BcrD ATPase family protein [Leucobacter sp. UT-8R-CII-1-4]|uniref:N-acetylglucosamine kinase n=1 Tax=Leucobacter sp. UT-8R-CII-1-4 TaxID=3040075 RepID=UPI0024A92E9E|nr:BadF/BadG/BcrA/BcrD ATPase family protein [Leucobacter sp. UT-8R-CII-1-4]MDI6022584.1 BadF/BadG/BcrA/BcrD ATPase family protein [Leucobacter sp. UT-8R-CII-1-4]
MSQPTLLAIDIGGSGSRLALLHAGKRRELTGSRVSVRGSGDGVARLTRELCQSARDAWPEEFAAVRALGLGSTGLATLVADPGALARELSDTLAGATRAVQPPAVAVAIDGVTAHLGALGGADGAVIALGTGSVAIGLCEQSWRRVDGWGHLLGDRGSGSWIGAQALQSAMRCYDGVSDAGRALLEAARARFGDPYSWPAQLYTRDDRAGVMAAFAAEVIQLAGEDSEAARIIAEAARSAAESALAALTPTQPPVVALVGGLTGSDSYVSKISRELAAARADVQLVVAHGDPLNGAVRLAELAAAGAVSQEAPFVWTSWDRHSSDC